MKRFYFFLAAILFLCFTSEAQIKLKDLGNKVTKKLERSSISDILQGEPPITTSLPDAKWEVKDSVVTPKGSKKSLLTLQRTPNGGFILQPGYYEMHTQSYCLKAGTHGPGGGDGYIYAPPIGKAEEAVMSIIRNSVNKPEIPQSQVQQLLWAIIARAKFEDLRTELKAVATQLLTPKQIAMLNRTALDLVPGPAMDKATASMPPFLRQIVEAESKLRKMLTDPSASFAQMEAVAVLTGAASLGEGSRAIKSGAWSRHPDGYFVRYLPQGYSYTVTEIWVPQGSSAIGKEYDPAAHIAVPGNTSRQRLIQSGREKKK